MLIAGHVYFGDVSGRGCIHINCWISSQHGNLANICDFFFSTWLTFPQKGFFPWVMCHFLGVMNTNDAGRRGGHRWVQITEFYMILLPFINLVFDTGFHSDFLWRSCHHGCYISSLFGYKTTELEGSLQLWIIEVNPVALQPAFQREREEFISKLWNT